MREDTLSFQLNALMGELSFEMDELFKVIALLAKRIEKIRAKAGLSVH